MRSTLFASRYDAIGHFGQSHIDLRDFGLQATHPLLHLAHVIAQNVNRPADVAQVLKHDDGGRVQIAWNKQSNQATGASSPYRHSIFFTS